MRGALRNKRKAISSLADLWRMGRLPGKTLRQTATNGAGQPTSGSHGGSGSELLAPPLSISRSRQAYVLIGSKGQRRVARPSLTTMPK